MDTVEFLKGALVAISTGNREPIEKFFAEDCCFQVPTGPYRVDSVAEYLEVVSRHSRLGATLEYLHVRQPRVISLDGTTEAVAFNWVSRSSLDGVISSGVGYGTAVLAESKVRHLHITRYAPAPVAHGEAATSGGMRDNLLDQLLWSDSPDPM